MSLEQSLVAETLDNKPILPLHSPSHLQNSGCDAELPDLLHLGTDSLAALLVDRGNRLLRTLPVGGVHDHRVVVQLVVPLQQGLIKLPALGQHVRPFERVGNRKLEPEGGNRLFAGVAVHVGLVEGLRGDVRVLEGVVQLSLFLQDVRDLLRCLCS